MADERLQALSHVMGAHDDDVLREVEVRPRPAGPRGQDGAPAGLPVQDLREVPLIAQTLVEAVRDVRATPREFGFDQSPPLVAPMAEADDEIRRASSAGPMD